MVNERAIERDNEGGLAEGALRVDNLGVDGGGHFDGDVLVVGSGDVLEKTVESGVDGI